MNENDDVRLYTIILRLDNNGTLEWKFNSKYDRDKEYNQLKQDLIYE